MSKTNKSKGASNEVKPREETTARHNANIMAVASKEVLTMSPTTPIIEAIKTMTSRGFRRIPIAHGGTKKLEGMITSLDIIDLLGGGNKSKFIVEGHKGNLFSAINAPVREIMEHKVISVNETATVDEAIKLMREHHVSGLPVVDKDDRAIAICTEKDIMRFLAGHRTNEQVYEYMSKGVETASYEMKIGEAASLMLSRGFRRLPIIEDGKLVGLITASDIMYYLGKGKAFEKLFTGNIHEAFDESVATIVSTKEVISIGPDKNIGEAAKMMLEKHIGSMPVMDKGVLVGIITERDFLRAAYK